MFPKRAQVNGLYWGLSILSLLKILLIVHNNDSNKKLRTVHNCNLLIYRLRLGRVGVLEASGKSLDRKYLKQRGLGEQ